MTDARDTTWLLTRKEFLRVLGVLSAAGVAGGLASCGRQSPEDDGVTASPTASPTASIRQGGTLSIAFTDASSSESLDPATSFGLSNDMVYNAAIYEPLIRERGVGVVEPLLATDWEHNADITEWTFTLQQGVRFHDGSLFTSKDAAHTIRRILDPDVGSPLWARLAASLDPESVQTPNDTTLVLRMKRPDSLMPLALSARQAKIVKADTTEFAIPTAIGTGPFRIVSWTPGQSWSVERHSDYWQDGLPYLDEVRGTVIPDHATKVQSVLSGTHDLGDPIDHSSASSVEQSEAAELLIEENALSLDIAMDETVEPFDDPRVRMAIKLCQERATLLQTVSFGYGETTSDTPTTPSTPFYPPDLGVREQNIDEARNLMSQAGYGDGLELELHTTAAAGGMVDLAVAFKSQAEEAGITINVEQVPAGTYWSEVWQAKPMFVSFWHNRHPAEALAIQYITGADWNETKGFDSEVDRLVEESFATSDATEQQSLLQDALLRVANERGKAIPFYQHKLWVKKKNVQGLEPSGQEAMLVGAAGFTE